MGRQVRDPERAAGAPTRLVRGRTVLGVTEERTERGQCPPGGEGTSPTKGDGVSKGLAPGKWTPRGKTRCRGGGGPNLAFDGRTVLS